MKLVERLSAPLIFLLLAAYVLNQSVYKPVYNWDMIGYIAAAKSFEERNIESLHSFTYDQLQNYLPSEVFEAKIHGAYGRAIYKDSSAFKEQLPFYQIRPIYNGLIYLLYKIGVNIGFATHIISGVAIVLAIIILYFMSCSFLAKPLVFAVPPLAVIFGMVDLATFSTPDGLAFLAVILSVYLFLKKRTTLLLIILPTMLGIRTDLILFTIPLLFFVFVFDRGSRWKVVLSILMSAAIYISIGAYWGHPGWSTVFYLTMVGYLTHPISNPPTLTIHQYFDALLQETKTVIGNRTFIHFILVVAYTFYLTKKYAKTTLLATALKFPSLTLTIVCSIFVVSHFLIFPMIHDRFFSAPYLVSAFSLLMIITHYLKVSSSTQKGMILEGDSE
jgi:hypothetical protein